MWGIHVPPLNTFFVTGVVTNLFLIQYPSTPVDECDVRGSLLTAGFVSLVFSIITLYYLPGIPVLTAVALVVVPLIPIVLGVWGFRDIKHCLLRRKSKDTVRSSPGDIFFLGTLLILLSLPLTAYLIHTGQDLIYSGIMAFLGGVMIGLAHAIAITRIRGSGGS